MMNSLKNPPENGIEMLESKFEAVTSTMSGCPDHEARRKAEITNMILRLLCLISSVISISFMATAEESGTISIYGFPIPLYSKWFFSYAFEYQLGMSVAVAAYSLLQLLLSLAKMRKKSPVILSRNHAWLIFAGDQAFAYAMMSAGSAALGVTHLNRTGIRYTPLPDFCKPLHRFCDHIAVSIAFAFFSFFLLATSAVLNMIWLSKS